MGWSFSFFTLVLPPCGALNSPGWVTIWSLEPGLQRGDALRYLDNHFWVIGACVIGLCSAAYGPWSYAAVNVSVLLGILSVSAVWLYLAIKWVDRQQGWAEQQARKGAVPEKTAPSATEDEHRRD